MKKIKILTAVVLCVCMLFSFSSLASAAAAKLTYSYSGSTATVKDCNTDATGTVKIPSKVTYNSKSYTVKFIGQDAFAGCKYIKTINIPKGVTAIKSGAFYNCLSLTDVYVPATVVSCAYDAFEGCEGVTVHCYQANYQFFSVLGFSDNITIDVVDAPAEQPEADQEDNDSLNIGGIGLGDIINGEVDFEAIIGGIIGGEGEDSDSGSDDFIEIDTSREGLTQMITRMIQMFIYIFRTYFAK